MLQPSSIHLLLLVGGGGINTSLDKSSSCLLPELVQSSKESILGSSVGLSIPFLIVPTSQLRQDNNKLPTG
jgi:hypothetical protein